MSWLLNKSPRNFRRSDFLAESFLPLYSSRLMEEKGWNGRLQGEAQGAKRVRQ
jgi:hypothetical protein